MMKALSLRQNTLLVATTVDPASLNIATSLISRQNLWKELCQGKVWQSKSDTNNIFLWLQDRPLLHMNYVDRLFQEEVRLQDQHLHDVIFLSKHYAASGIPSLTVHPIGIPWTTDIVRNGGLPGRCSPPNFRIGPLFRSLAQRVGELNVEKTYQVTLEATHHGPYCDLPTCFVEIGSSESEWSVKASGEIWADVLTKHFDLQERELENLDTVVQTSAKLQECSLTATNDVSSLVATTANSSASSSATSSTSVTHSRHGVVMMLIGGGHYVPKMNDALKFGEGLYVGHCLATYTLSPYFQKPSTGTKTEAAHEEDEESGAENSETSADTCVSGGWEHVVTEAVQSTRITYPDVELICLVDKKAFLAKQRDDILALLTKLGCKHTFKLADVKSLWEQTMKLSRI